MSTRVLPVGGYINYIRMSDLRRRIQPPSVTVTQESQAQDQGPPNITTSMGFPQSRAVRRNLFGPIDHDENMKFVQEELTKIADADARRWNFDFRNESPLDGRYTWENATASKVPEAYEMPNLTTRLTASPSTSALPKPAPQSKTTTLPTTLPTTATVQDNHPLQTTLQSITTAVTTILTSVSKPKPVCGKLELPESAVIPKIISNTEVVSQTLSKKSVDTTAKQTKMTDFLKTRKRPSSAVEVPSKSDDASSPPLKRAKTST